MHGTVNTIGEQLPPDSIIFGKTEAMRQVQRKLERVADANLPVLIQGESGTGKEVIAKLIHSRSPWRNGRFVKVSCPSIPRGLLESELFGYEKGAFTGANGNKPGRVEAANHGTLFFDEIAELDAAAQAKLLQLLQDGSFSRLGGEYDASVQVRVVCSTKAHIEHAIRAGVFRQDLFFRINVVSICLPTLKERRIDIPAIASYFYDHYREKFGRRLPPLSDLVVARFQEYSWPGNIRELENFVRLYVVLGSDDAILSELASEQRAQVTSGVPVHAGPISLKEVTKTAVAQLERKLIFDALEANRWNGKRAARALGLSYRALWYKLREAGVTTLRRRPARDSS